MQGPIFADGGQGPTAPLNPSLHLAFGCPLHRYDELWPYDNASIIGQLRLGWTQLSQPTTFVTPRRLAVLPNVSGPWYWAPFALLYHTRLLPHLFAMSPLQLLPPTLLLGILALLLHFRLVHCFTQGRAWRYLRRTPVEDEARARGRNPEVPKGV